MKMSVFGLFFMDIVKLVWNKNAREVVHTTLSVLMLFFLSRKIMEQSYCMKIRKIW